MSKWKPIDTAPKSEREIIDLYMPYERFCTTVLIGRADEPLGDGVISGCVAECSITDDGRWVSPVHIGMVEMFGEWSELKNPTHWQPLPKPPTFDTIRGVRGVCWCNTCTPNTIFGARMILCPDCGNKRCPKATHHANACTNSNEVGQPGTPWELIEPATNHNNET
jgi:hypothetical protein